VQKKAARAQNFRTVVRSLSAPTEILDHKPFSQMSHSHQGKHVTHKQTKTFHLLEPAPGRGKRPVPRIYTRDRPPRPPMGRPGGPVGPSGSGPPVVTAHTIQWGYAEERWADTAGLPGRSGGGGAAGGRGSVPPPPCRGLHLPAAAAAAGVGSAISHRKARRSIRVTAFLGNTRRGGGVQPSAVK